MGAVEKNKQKNKVATRADGYTIYFFKANVSTSILFFERALRQVPGC